MIHYNVFRDRVGTLQEEPV